MRPEFTAASTIGDSESWSRAWQASTRITRLGCLRAGPQIQHLWQEARDVMVCQKRERVFFERQGRHRGEEAEECGDAEATRGINVPGRDLDQQRINPVLFSHITNSSALGGTVQYLERNGKGKRRSGVVLLPCSALQMSHPNPPSPKSRALGQDFRKQILQPATGIDWVWLLQLRPRQGL